MVVLGIDPGYERMGWGVVVREGSRIQALGHGVIVTPRVGFGERLRLIDAGVTELLETYHPSALATERLFFGKNTTTGLDVAKALGVALCAAAKRGLETVELTPAEVKQAVVGVGNAEKRQVQMMVTRLLGLAEMPKPDDAADALAVAIGFALRGPAARL